MKRAKNNLKLLPFGLERDRHGRHVARPSQLKIQIFQQRQGVFPAATLLACADGRVGGHKATLPEGGRRMSQMGIKWFLLGSLYDFV